MPFKAKKMNKGASFNSEVRRWGSLYEEENTKKESWEYSKGLYRKEPKNAWKSACL